MCAPACPGVPSQHSRETQRQTHWVCFRVKKALVSLTHLLAAESSKETQAVRVKEEPMEVDIQDPPVSMSPGRNVGYSTLMGREKAEPLQKLPEGRVPPERNLFSQDISVKMASELLFQLSGRGLWEMLLTEKRGCRAFLGGSSGPRDGCFGEICVV